MGLRDRIKERNKKKKEKEKPEKQDKESEEEDLKGGKVVAESKEEFLQTVEELRSKFKGAMLLYGDLEGDICRASFLIKEGEVVGATFDYMDTVLEGDEALKAIKNKLSGSEGQMELYQFKGKDMEKALDKNEEALLDKPISVRKTGLKIKYLMDNWAKKQKKKEKGDRFKVPQMPKKGKKKNLDLLTLAKDQAPKKKKSKVMHAKKGKKGKPNLMAGAKSKQKPKGKKKVGENGKRKISPEQKETEGDEQMRKVIGGKKVETHIDSLLKIVRKKGSVRINNKLAKKLKVKKSQIEEWAIILENHDLVQLHYPTIGDPEIRSVD